jgi:hypothetical protein
MCMSWGWICPLVSETSEPHPGTRDCKDITAEHFDSLLLAQMPRCNLDKFISFSQVAPLATLPPEGCGVAKWLVRRAAVRQPRVRIPPGTPPLVQPRKIQGLESNGADFSQRSSRRVSPSSRMNIVSILRTESTKINKKSAGKGPKILKKNSFFRLVQTGKLKILNRVRPCAQHLK